MAKLIKNDKKAKQLIDFSDILPPPLCLTDIDAGFEYHDNGYLFVEVKTKDKPVPIGQRIFLERITKRLSSTGVKAVAIIVEHDIINPDNDVILKDGRVRKVFWGDEGEWDLPKKPCTAGEFISSYYKWLDKLEKSKQGR